MAENAGAESAVGTTDDSSGASGTPVAHAVVERGPPIPARPADSNKPRLMIRPGIDDETHSPAPPWLTQLTAGSATRAAWCPRTPKRWLLWRRCSRRSKGGVA